MLAALTLCYECYFDVFKNNGDQYGWGGSEIADEPLIGYIEERYI